MTAVILTMLAEYVRDLYRRPFLCLVHGFALAEDLAFGCAQDIKRALNILKVIFAYTRIARRHVDILMAK